MKRPERQERPLLRQAIKNPADLIAGQHTTWRAAISGAFPAVPRECLGMGAHACGGPGGPRGVLGLVAQALFVAVLLHALLALVLVDLGLAAFLDGAHGV